MPAQPARAWALAGMVELAASAVDFGSDADFVGFCLAATNSAEEAAAKSAEEAAAKAAEAPQGQAQAQALTESPTWAVSFARAAASLLPPHQSLTCFATVVVPPFLGADRRCAVSY
jgi:hypothetical protein